jgi:hypothetical protein
LNLGFVLSRQADLAWATPPVLFFFLIKIFLSSLCLTFPSLPCSQTWQFEYNFQGVSIKRGTSWHWWLIPVIPGTQEAEIKRITGQASLGK